MANVATFSRFQNIAAAVQIGNPPNQVYTECLDGEELQIEWSCSMDIGSQSNSGSVRITNLDTETEIPVLEKIAELQTAFAFDVVLSFGWDGVVQELYQAPILKIRPSIFTGTDVVSEIEFSDFAKAGPRASPVGKQLDQVFWEQAFIAIAETMGATLSFQFKEKLKTIPIATTGNKLAIVAGNNPRRDFSDLVASLGPQYGWTVQNREIFLTSFGLYQDSPKPYVLNYDTGLLSVTPLDEGGFDVTASGIPSLRPGHQVIIEDETTNQLGGGAVRVEAISWTGDSYVGCEMGFTARKLGQFS